jgi:hypothetical protein
VQLLQAMFCKRPKTFDAINILATTSVFVFAMTNPKMFFKADIKQAVVATLFIGTNYHIWRNSPADNCLERFLGAVGKDFGINVTVSF